MSQSEPDGRSPRRLATAANPVRRLRRVVARIENQLAELRATVETSSDAQLEALKASSEAHLEALRFLSRSITEISIRLEKLERIGDDTEA